MADTTVRTSTSNDAYQTETVSHSFHVPLNKSPYRVPEEFAVYQEGRLDLTASQEKISTFIAEFDKLVTPDNAIEVGKSFTRSLGISPSNWEDFQRQFPTLISPVKIQVFHIASLMLQGSNDNLAAARFLSDIVVYKGYGINRTHRLISATRLSECYYTSNDPNVSKGENIYNDLVVSLRYSIGELKTEHEMENTDGHGACYDLETDSFSIHVNAGNDVTVFEAAEATLDGSRSKSTGKIQSYHWEQTKGPAVSWISGQIGPKPVFRTPQVFGDKILEFRLTITDENGTPYSDTVTANLRNTINETPKVALHGPKEVKAGDPVKLTATHSDPNGETLIVSWQEKTKFGLRMKPAESAESTRSHATFIAPDVGNEAKVVKVQVLVDDQQSVNNLASAEWSFKVLPNPDRALEIAKAAPQTQPIPPATKTKPTTKANEAATPPKAAPIASSSTKKTKSTQTQISKPVAASPKPVKSVEVTSAPTKIQAPKTQASTQIEASISDPIAKSPLTQENPIPTIPEPVTPTFTTLDQIEMAFTTADDSEQKNARILILFDISESMNVAANSFQSRSDAIINQLLSQIPDDGYIEIAIGSYLNSETYIYSDFVRAAKSDPESVAKLNTTLKHGAQSALLDMQNRLGGGETLWHSMHDVMSGDKKLAWANNPEDAKQIIYAITDSELYNEENIIDFWTPKTCNKLAMTKGISLTTIQVPTEVEMVGSLGLPTSHPWKSRQVKVALVTEPLHPETPPLILAPNVNFNYNIGVPPPPIQHGNRSPNLTINLISYAGSLTLEIIPGSHDKPTQKEKEQLAELNQLKEQELTEAVIKFLEDQLETHTGSADKKKEALVSLMPLLSAEKKQKLLLKILKEAGSHYPDELAIEALEFANINQAGEYVFPEVLEQAADDWLFEHVTNKSGTVTEPQRLAAVRMLSTHHHRLRKDDLSEKKANVLFALVIDSALSDEIRLVAARSFQDKPHAAGQAGFVSIVQDQRESLALRTAAVKALKNIGSEATDKMLTMMILDNKTTDALVTASIDALTAPTIENPELTMILLRILNNQTGARSAATRLAAAAQLESNSHPQVQKSFMAILKNPKEGDLLKTRAAQALKTNASPEAVAAIIEATNNNENSPEVRSLCADALLELARVSAVAAIYLATLGPKHYMYTRLSSGPAPRSYDVLAELDQNPH